VYLYSAFFVVPHTQGARAWVTRCYLQLHQWLRLPPYVWRCAAKIAIFNYHLAF